MKLQTSGVLGTSYAIAKLAPKRGLLRHSSSKTTEIYTHITTKGFEKIENPLDKLDVLI